MDTKTAAAALFFAVGLLIGTLDAIISLAFGAKTTEDRLKYIGGYASASFMMLASIAVSLLGK